MASGNLTELMTSFAFDFEWVDPMGAKGPELRATWARLSIIAGDSTVTRVYDVVSRSVRDSIYLPLYPLAEWLVTHWWFLFHEIEPSGRISEQEYGRRHNLRFAREGFALPSLSIVPVGESIRLGWKPEKLSSCRVEFLGEGNTHIPTDDFRESITILIQAVVERLEQYDVYGTLLQQEWAAVRDASPDEASFCAAAAALGLDPFSLTDEQAETITIAGNSIPESVLKEFFEAADFLVLREQTEHLLEAIDVSRSNPADLEPLRRLQAEMLYVPRPVGAPWNQGYALARDVRHRLGLNGQPLVSFDDLSHALGIRPHELEQAIAPTMRYRDVFDAVVDVNDRGSPGFVISNQREDIKKFAFCRGLFEYLTFEPGLPLMVTKARSDRQKRNRAFAAEFLVPAGALRQRIHTRTIAEEEIDDLADAFGVSPHVVRHQIENHGIARTLLD
ncbi:MAG TPA: hypothetical protein VK399_03315 [Longimicrobiaceae bacterium]|nr:hypothetical protein [Longimicrobiaceae bacterium]